MVKAIGLFSGGLDSLLAACLVREQGIEVECLTFETPFFAADKAREAAEQINMNLTVIDLTAEYIPMLKNPKYGYGKNMNPCIDCHALMFKIAGKYMVDKKADFLFTGEVLGERPKSQNRNSLDIVAKESTFKGYILRPLCAKLLHPTTPEMEGLINREKLLDISGRSRKRQMQLAEKYGIKTYQTPAGGCLLTYKGFSDKLKDLFEHNENPSLRDYKLLKIGRHFRLSDSSKFIAGKDLEDNIALESLRISEDTMIYPEDYKGPIGLIICKDEFPVSSDIYLSARIIARYCKPHEEKKRIIVDTKNPQIPKFIDVEKLSPEETDSYFVAKR
ncbi:hypothetical protein J7L67_05490 [bacterium]|nr:hypothetical protein [bacterium]